jgi:bacillithiol biosynthesis deacetylase BshB1
VDEALDILAVAAHPDDAELGCGGSLLLAADRGLRVAIADLSDGERSSRGTPERRAQERERAAKLLGLRARLSVGLPDAEIGSDPEHRLAVVRLIRDTRPRVVLAPYTSDRHPDHAAAGRLVQEAVFFAGVRKVDRGRPHRPERLFHYMLHHPFAPSFVVDVSRVWERKMAAVAAYRSQFGSEGAGAETPISRPEFFPRLVEARGIWFGAMIGAEYGEPFLLRGPVPARELPGLDGPPGAPGELPPYCMW